MRIFVVLGAFLIVAALSGATYQWLATRKELAATPPPGRLVDIGGYRLHVWCTGDGAPAVILDTGLGGSSADWGFVQPDVARFTRVCSYDRAGMGYSDQASLSERGCLIIAEQSGHVVPIDQPEVVVDAIRTVVDAARGHDVPLCATPAPNVHREPLLAPRLHSNF